MIKVLIIDEEEASVADGKARLEKAGYICERIDFDDLDDKLLNYSPDIIVLDMMNGPHGADSTGEGGKLFFEKIWVSRFCPIVVYSADPDLIDAIEPGKAKHPLVKRVQKGKDSDVKLEEMINNFKPCVEGMNGTAKDINTILQTTLRDVAPHIYSYDGIVDKETAIKHMTRRRISALMDGSTILREKLAPWEQYICPPLADYPNMGDIIRNSSKDDKDPESFLIVLTPTCDLVKVDRRNPKVSKVLCAQCESADVLFLKAQVKKDKESLAKELRQGYIKEYLPIPEFPGIIPAMVANMKNLILVPYESIGKKGEGKEFIITASVDSPFREQIAWVYLSTSGRPGVPDRDCNLWAEQYLPDDGKGKGEKTS